MLLGYYPLVKPRFDRIRPRALQLVCKLLLCNGAVLAMYGLLLVLVPAGSISQELRTTALAMTLLTRGYGQRGVCPLRPRPVQSAAAVQAEVAAQTA